MASGTVVVADSQGALYDAHQSVDDGRCSGSGIPPGLVAATFSGSPSNPIRKTAMADGTVVAANEVVLINKATGVATKVSASSFATNYKHRG